MAFIYALLVDPSLAPGRKLPVGDCPINHGGAYHSHNSLPTSYPRDAQPSLITQPVSSERVCVYMYVYHRYEIICICTYYRQPGWAIQYISSLFSRNTCTTNYSCLHEAQYCDGVSKVHWPVVSLELGVTYLSWMYSRCKLSARV